jgi:serine/threonine protein phosphatase PrpC
MSGGSSERLHYHAAVHTHQGKVKDHNEDFGALRQLDAGLALAVADGMTRLVGGEEASRLAAEALLASLPPNILSQGEEPQLEALISGFEAAQLAIEARVEEDMGLTGMGTTLVAALLGPERVTYQYAGDSRLYWLREGAVLRITRDHSVVQALVELGRVKPDEAESHPMAGKLTSHLGGGSKWGSFQISPDPDESAAFVPEPGDVILLCSDGVSVELSDTVLAELACCSGSAEERAELILDAVLETSARDNATVALAVVVDHEG